MACRNSCSRRTSEASAPLNGYSKQRELALHVESCSPGLLRLARHSALGGCGLSAGVLAAGPVQPSYSSEPPALIRGPPVPKTRPQESWADIVGTRTCSFAGTFRARPVPTWRCSVVSENNAICRIFARDAASSIAGPTLMRRCSTVLSRTTKIRDFRGLSCSESPLTDSNRRPPPYPRGSVPGSKGKRWKPRPRMSRKHAESAEDE